MKIRPIAPLFRRFAAVVALGAVVSVAHADVPPANAPDVKTIIEKMTAAAGGVEKLSAIKSLELKGTVAAPQAGIDGTITLRTKNGDAVMEMELANLGVMKIGKRGDVVYEQSDLTGVRLITGPEREMLIRDLNPLEQTGRLERLKDLKVAAADKIDDNAVWQLTGTTEAGKTETHWVDQKSFLTRRIKMIVPTQMGEIEAVVTLRDYKTVDGIPVPTTSEQEARGVKMVMTFNDVKLNPTLADEVFALPAAVKKLAEKQAPQSDAPTTQPAVPK